MGRCGGAVGWQEAGRVVVHFGDRERLVIELDEAANTLTLEAPADVRHWPLTP